MHRLFCCRNRNTNRVEVDEITDSIEKCLSVERGVTEFKLFLQKNVFETELTTLQFVLECPKIITELSRLSPVLRGRPLAENLQRDIRNLCAMAEYINFDASQMDNLQKLENTHLQIAEIINILEGARSSAIDLLRHVYATFRRETLRNV